MTREQDTQRERMRQALDEKAERAQAAEADASAEEASAEAHEEQLEAQERPQDELSVRAKSAGKGKKTADKWNQ